jgi:hypothetical protein
MINKKSIKIGQHVTYVDLTKDPVISKYQHGVVKSIPEEGNHIFVVYNCDKDWNNYMDYTAEWTGLWKLKKGWL